MRGYFLPRSSRGRALLAAYVAIEAVLGLATYELSYPLAGVAQAVGYVLMAPTLILALPFINAIGYTGALVLALLFALGALGNACLITYLRSADGRY